MNEPTFTDAELREVIYEFELEPGDLDAAVYAAIHCATADSHTHPNYAGLDENTARQQVRAESDASADVINRNGVLSQLWYLGLGLDDVDDVRDLVRDLLGEHELVPVGAAA